MADDDDTILTETDTLTGAVRQYTVSTEFARSLQADAPVGGGGEHLMSLTPAPKMDAAELVATRCSCGSYVSAPGTEDDAIRSWLQHVSAKTRAERARRGRLPRLGDRDDLQP